MPFYGDGETVPEVKKPVQPGETYSGVPRLAHSLNRVGDLPTDAGLGPGRSVYDGALVDAVRSFQQRHGLTADGIVSEDSVVHFYDDIYGHDATLEQAFAHGYPS